jgi:hypothetical protein
MFLQHCLHQPAHNVRVERHAGFAQEQQIVADGALSTIGCVECSSGAAVLVSCATSVQLDLMLLQQLTFFVEPSSDGGVRQVLIALVRRVLSQVSNRQTRAAATQHMRVQDVVDVGTIEPASVSDSFAVWHLQIERVRSSSSSQHMRCRTLQFWSAHRALGRRSDCTRRRVLCEVIRDCLLLVSVCSEVDALEERLHGEWKGEHEREKKPLYETQRILSAAVRIACSNWKLITKCKLVD